MNLLLIFTFYHKYLKYEKNYNLGNKKVLYLICTNVIVLIVLSEYKIENGTASMNIDSQWSKQEAYSIYMFCMCDSGVTRCQSQRQCHFWGTSLMFEAYCAGKWPCKDHEYHPQILLAVNNEFAADSWLSIVKLLLTA